MYASDSDARYSTAENTTPCPSVALRSAHYYCTLRTLPARSALQAHSSTAHYCKAFLAESTGNRTSMEYSMDLHDCASKEAASKEVPVTSSTAGISIYVACSCIQKLHAVADAKCKKYETTSSASVTRVLYVVRACASLVVGLARSRREAWTWTDTGQTWTWRAKTERRKRSERQPCKKESSLSTLHARYTSATLVDS